MENLEVTGVRSFESVFYFIGEGKNKNTMYYAGYEEDILETF